MKRNPGTALVTGGARRIGRALCLALAEAGYGVAIHFRESGDEALELAREIQDRGGRAGVFRADLALAGETAALIPDISTRLGRVTLLVNNASVFRHDDIRTVTEESLGTHLSVNLGAPFLLSRALADNLPGDKKGCIINILDTRVWRLTPHFTSYTLSRTALWTLTRVLAMALAPRIRVNAVGPGPVLRSVFQTDRDFAAQVAATPLGRPTTPEEVAAAALFLAGAESITGQMLATDGGKHLPWQPDSGGGHSGSREHPAPPEDPGRPA